MSTREEQIRILREKHGIKPPEESATQPDRAAQIQAIRDKHGLTGPVSTGQQRRMIETVRRSVPGNVQPGPTRAAASAPALRPEGRLRPRTPRERVVPLGERFRSAAASVAQALGDVPPGLIEQAAIIGQEIEDKYPDLASVGGIDLNEGAADNQRKALEAAARVREWTAQAFPTNPELAGRFVEDVLPRAFGSMAGFMLTGGAARAVGASSLRATAAAGSATAGSGAYREALELGADEETAREAALPNMALGLTEALPVEGILNAGVRAARTGAGNVARSAAISAGEETLQETAQTIGGNMIARETYDPNREVMDGVPQAAAAAAITGGATSVGATGSGRLIAQRRQRNNAPAPATLAGQPAATPPPAEAVQAEAAEKAMAGVPVIVAPRRQPGEAPAPPNSVENGPPPAGPAQQSAAPGPVAPVTLPPDIQPQVTPAPTAEITPSSPSGSLQPVPLQPIAETAEENSEIIPAPGVEEVIARALAILPTRYQGGTGKPQEAFVRAYRAGLLGERMPLVGRLGNATRDGYQAGIAARTDPAPAAEAPPVAVPQSEPESSITADAPERVDLLGNAEAPTVEQAGLFTARDLAPAERAEAERISSRPMNADEVAANTQANGIVEERDSETGDLLETAPVARGSAMSFLDEVSTGPSYLDGLDGPAPVEPAATRTPEDPEYQYDHPSRRGIMYGRDLGKARAMTDAALLNAYKERVRVAIRTDSDRMGKGGSYARANATSAEARLLAYEQVIEARGLDKPSTIDAWRDVPEAEKAERFTMFSAMEEANGMDDTQLLDAVEDARTRYFVDPGDRGKAERLYTYAGIAKDRGLIGSSMFTEDIGELYSGDTQQKTARLIRRRRSVEARAQRDPSNARMFEAMQALGSGGKRYAPAGESLDSPTRMEARPTATRARIDPDPITGGAVKPLDEIILDLSKAVSRRIRRAKTRGGATGTYFPGSARTIIRYAGDLDVTAHEVAHALDDRYGIVSDYAAPRARSPFDSELIPHFSQYGSGSKSGPRSRLSYRRAEGVAEWVRAWIVNPVEAEARAPGFAAHFQSKVPSSTLDALRSFSTDVRTFAGLSAHERTKANIESEPTSKQKKYRDELRAKLRGEGYEVTGFTWLDNLNAQLFDSLAPVMSGVSAAKRLRGVDILTPDSDPAILTRLFGGMGEKIEDVLARGMVDGKNERVTKGGIDWLLGWADTSSSESVGQDLRDVAAFMVNERVIEKADQIDAEADTQVDALEARVADGTLSPDRAARMIGRIRQAADRRKSQLSGAGGGIFADHEQAEAALAESLRWPTEKRERIEEGAKRYRQWANGVLRYMVDKGRLAERVENAEGELIGGYELIRERNEYYVAMHRIATEIDPETFGARGAGGGRLGSAAKTIERFTGSTRMIGNPYINLIKQTETMMREADRNEALRSFTDLLRSNRGMYQGEVADLDSIGSRAQAGDVNAIPVWVDGREERWQFEPKIHEALKGWGLNDSPGPIELALMLPGRVMRYFVTHSPDFLVRNVIRDTSHRSIMSRTGGKPWDVFHWLTADEKSALRLGGGGQAGWYGGERANYYRELERHMKKLSGEKGSILAMPSKIKEGWDDLSQASEMIGRLAEYRSALKHAKEELGYDDHNAQLYAAYQARDLIDYAVAGTIIKKVNRYVPFTNPAFQGLRRTVRAAKDNPKQLAKLWAIYALTPTLLFYAINAARGDEEEYAQQPAYLRDFFFNVKIWPDLWLRIPKSFEAGVLASGVERAIDAARGKERAFDGYFDSLLNSFAPFDEDAVLGPFRTIFEIRGNYDYFRERHIISPFEEGRDLELRQGAERASRLGKALSEIVPMDPRFIDHAIKSQFGGMGRLGLNLSNIGRNETQRTGGGLHATGLVVNSPAQQSADVDWAMERARELGLESRPMVLGLKRRLNRYYDATTAVERDQRASEVRDYATNKVRPWLEERAARAPVETVN